MPHACKAWVCRDECTFEKCISISNDDVRTVSKIDDREAAIRKLERIANSNLENCLRLLKHNKGHDISFFRLSSKLIPLANHEELLEWNYIRPLKENLKVLGDYAIRMNMRIDFHPIILLYSIHLRRIF